jgi:putative membrane protein
MQGIVLRTLITMLGLFLASALVPGVSITGAWTFIFAAILLGLVNAVVRPIAFVLTLPITLVTLGLFILVLNAAMFGLVASLLDNFVVSGFWSALFGAIIVSITSREPREYQDAPDRLSGRGPRIRRDAGLG